MKCELCNKNEATVHLTEIVNNKVSKLHICEECAREKGQEMETHFGLSDLLAGLADFNLPTHSDKKIQIKCKSCGFSLSDFEKEGRLGCPGCYASFKEHLLPLLKRIHGSTAYVGKVPLKSTKPGENQEAIDLQKAKIEIQKAIAAEDFEKAAMLRDKIDELMKKLEEKA